jgi:hypothetical protein
MNLDDLKRGLTTLSDEMDPFEGNVRALHRRERRRRVAVSSIAALVVVAIAVATVAIARNGDSGKIHVAGVPSKEVTPAEITHIDAIVVPASPAVKAALDASPLVGRYALIPGADRSWLSPLLTATEPVKSALCLLQTSNGYAVDAVIPGSSFDDGLARALAGTATVTVTDQYRTDAEFFMKVNASTQQVAAVLAALTVDPDVQSFKFISKNDAYTIFKKDFADQPALVDSTKPSDLPESFRVMVKPGRPLATVVERYKHREGVDTTITPAVGWLFLPPTAIKDSGKYVSPCAKP